MLGLASIGAGAIHLALGPAHMTEWKVLGYGFLAAGVAQISLGLLLLVTGSRRVLVLATLTTLGLIGVWLASRTTGLPVGPSAGQAEGVGVADLLSFALESVVALGALILLRRPSAGLAPAGRLAVRSVLSAMALTVVTTTGVAVAAPSHGHDDAPCPTQAIALGIDANGNGADDNIERYFACELHRVHSDHKPGDPAYK